MAKPIINTDQETLSFSDHEKIAAVVEMRKLGTIKTAADSALDFATQELEKWQDQFAHASDEQQVGIITQINGRRIGYERILGGLLDIVESAIFSGKKTGYKSLNAWIDANFNYTGVSKSEAYKYLAVYRSIDKDTFEDIGISKAAEIATAKDEKIREKLITIAKRDPEITVSQLKVKKEELSANKKKSSEDEEIESQIASLKISISVDGTKGLYLAFSSQRARDIFNDDLLDLVRVKRQIAERMVRERKQK